MTKQSTTEPTELAHRTGDDLDVKDGPLTGAVC